MQESAATTDELLMARFQQRLDASAFDQLVKRYLSGGVVVACHILSDRALAEDAAQEAFLRVIRNRDRYLPSKRFSVWFYTILRNVCVDMMRRHGREARAIAEIAAREKPERPAKPGDPPAALGLLARLPPALRDAVVLRVANGLRFCDVAAALGISQEAAKKRVQRGLRRLREDVAPRRFAAGSGGDASDGP